jgi:hypothetical protein
MDRKISDGIWRGRGAEAAFEHSFRGGQKRPTDA